MAARTHGTNFRGEFKGARWSYFSEREFVELVIRHEFLYWRFYSAVSVRSPAFL